MADNELIKDPLERLFVRSDEVNRLLLSDLLIKYIRIDEKANIFPLTPFYSETNKNKIILILLAKKVVALKTGAEESTAPRDISKLVDMPDGSLRPVLRDLVNEKMADDMDGNYKIFSHALERCAELLKKQGQKNVVEYDAEKKIFRKKISMRLVIESLLNDGLLDEAKNAREIHGLIQQRRPGTQYQPLYKVILDLVHQQKLSRDLKGSTWVYKKAAI